jgi:hypothetical protein
VIQVSRLILPHPPGPQGRLCHIPQRLHICNSTVMLSQRLYGMIRSTATSMFFNKRAPLNTVDLKEKTGYNEYVLPKDMGRIVLG